MLDVEKFNLLDDRKPEQNIKQKKTGRGCKRECTGGLHSSCIKLEDKFLYRRAFSELSLLEILDAEKFEDGENYHFMTGGDIDSLSYLKVILNKQDLDYCLLSTWCMSLDDILQIRQWAEQGRIKKLDCYVGEIFPGSYKREHEQLKQIVDEFKLGRVCVFKNHSKVFAGVGDRFSFGINSSANINTNPRTENGSIIIGDDIFNFYKDFFDDVHSFTDDYHGWEKWQDHVSR